MERYRYIIGVMILGLWMTGNITAQTNDIQREYRIHPVFTNETPDIDGLADESFWQKVETISDFYLHDPVLRPHGSPKTEVKVAYNREGLILWARNYQKSAPIIQTLKRDKEYWGGDGFTLFLDPTNGRQYGFVFGVNPEGVEMEGIVSQNSRDPIDVNWDNKWYSAVHYTPEYWDVEMLIPFKTLRFNKGNKIWGINFIRSVMNKNEYHTYTPVPEQFWGIDFGYTAALEWDNPPTSSGRNIVVIPYASGGVEKDEDGEVKPTFQVGGDAKVAVTKALNLDLTINPDFSNIEVDELVTNISRFSIFLPEKRTFFLENSDLFSGFGIPPIRPFFSRKIGLNDDGEAVPVIYGARLSGNVIPSLRIGAMNVHTKVSSGQYQNYSALTFQQTIGKRSNIRGMFLNRQGFDDLKYNSTDYGRNAGLELAYKSDNGNLTIWGGGHKSFKPGITGKDWYTKTGVLYKSKHWNLLHSLSTVGENYYADMGFISRIENYDAERDTIIRQGFIQTFNFLQYKLYPSSGWVNRHEFEIQWRGNWNPERKFNESNLSLNYITMFNNRSSNEIIFRSQWVDLEFPFSFIGEEPLPRGVYAFNSFTDEFRTDPRKRLSLKGEVSAGQFYNGMKYSMVTKFNYRVQPWGNFGLQYEYHDLRFPDPYGKEKINALNTRIEIGFSKALLWTTLFQYVQQQEFMGINSRIQWRFAPMSDLYIVYIDRYFAPETSPYTVGSNEGRALVLKVNYWLSI